MYRTWNWTRSQGGHGSNAGNTLRTAFGEKRPVREIWGEWHWSEILVGVVSSNLLCKMSQPTSVAASLTPEKLALKFCLKPNRLAIWPLNIRWAGSSSINKATKQTRRLMKSSVPRIISRQFCFMFQWRRRGCFSWIRALILICHCSYRGVVELLRDVFDFPISVGTIHNRLQAAEQAAINSPKICLIFAWGYTMKFSKASRLGGSGCSLHLLLSTSGGWSRDENTWGFHLLEAMEQGLHPVYDCWCSWGQDKAALADTPCHGDLFHIQQQCQSLTNILSRQAAGATSRRRLSSRCSKPNRAVEWTGA